MVYQTLLKIVMKYSKAIFSSVFHIILFILSIYLSYIAFEDLTQYNEGKVFLW